jgi:hypothetical protein
MFALRDFGAASKEAVLALAEGFGDGSALFRYVLPLLSILSHDLPVHHTRTHIFHRLARSLPAHSEWS